MPDAKVFDVPMELRLELMSVVRADFPDPEREFFNDVINEVDLFGLGVFFIDFERPHTRRIINRVYWKHRTFSPFCPMNVRNLTSIWMWCPETCF